MSEQNITDSPIPDEYQLEELGISATAYQEILHILGHRPTIDELSTLMALWQSNGQQQTLLQWLSFQPHSYKPEEYLQLEGDDNSVREPKVMECIEAAKSLAAHSGRLHKECRYTIPEEIPNGKLLLYMVGNVPKSYSNSLYAQEYLHLAQQAIEMESDEEEEQYLEMILSAMAEHHLVMYHSAIGKGGLFTTVAGTVFPRGFDILTCREVRLDSFLFGEEKGRQLCLLEEDNDNEFLIKINQAGLNCCFLGRTTKERILVDGTDFGRNVEFVR